MADDVAQKLRLRLPSLKESEVLAPYTTMKVGGRADYFFVAKTIDDLVLAVTAAWELDLPYFILAGGSNILVSDYGFPGLVVKNETQHLVFLEEKSQVIADSGTPLGFFIAQCASRGLSGFEWAGGIPGTIGGALYGNMAAWGSDNATINFVRTATLLVPPGWKGRNELARRGGVASERMGRGNDVAPPSIVTVKPSWFAAGYRTTKLKEMAAKGEKRIPVILTVRFQLSRKRQDEIIATLRHFQQYRQDRQPIGAMTMGSTFRNPGGFPTPATMTQNLQAAGWYIEQAGLKSKRVGGATISSKHANFLINDGTATARDVRKLIEEMQDQVREKFKIELREEIEYVGRW